ncbi:helix-turn-helix transcriptional regulator [Fulvivirga sp. 29W222]|uniref:Helix-turn-helix transcriptional regulator n=1 Tax=Fulvivirga marina TaxID=2494733 RepID=A0A937KFQ6_9BACT|nr:AraC family transcriptional regulator [Fulvivirga marina]MBL6448535.1 helix-turn-helix transcriptional regulator [Fulvivirga marina]
MSTTDIILVVLSGLGVIHGLFLALFLWTYPKGNTVANQLLGLLLIVLSFRIGKSVFLEFTENLDVKFIFTGLGAIFAMGPLFYLFVRSCCHKNFRLRFVHGLHFIPLLAGLGFGLWVEESHLTSLPMGLFITTFAAYYLHFLFYLVLGHTYALKQRQSGLDADVYHFLKLLFYGLLVIWVVYVLNLFEEQVPYIVGPILYSIVAYSVSFIVIRKGYMEKISYTKYQTTTVSGKQSEELYSRVLHLMNEEALYKQADLTLKYLSEQLKVSPQVLSMVINKMSQQNFNSFVNHYRVTEATRILGEEKYSNHTVAAIAYDVGFNSISSFNTAFKKQTGKTPVSYRKEVLK